MPRTRPSSSEYFVFQKNWMFGGLDRIALNSDQIVIRAWGRDKTYAWSEIQSAVLRQTELPVRGGKPLRRAALYLKTARRQYRIRLSNRYSSEIKNPERFLTELEKHLEIQKVSGPDASQKKLVLVWGISFLILIIFLLLKR